MPKLLLCIDYGVYNTGFYGVYHRVVFFLQLLVLVYKRFILLFFGFVSHTFNLLIMLVTMYGAVSIAFCNLTNSFLTIDVHVAKGSIRYNHAFSIAVYLLCYNCMVISWYVNKRDFVVYNSSWNTILYNSVIFLSLFMLALFFKPICTAYTAVHMFRREADTHSVIPAIFDLLYCIWVCYVLLDHKLTCLIIWKWHFISNTKLVYSGIPSRLVHVYLLYNPPNCVICLVMVP